MWYVGMDVGGTSIDCIALNTVEHTRSEAHQTRPLTQLPEEAAPHALIEFLQSASIKRSELQPIAIGWKHGRNKKRVILMMEEFAKQKFTAHVHWDAETAFIGALPAGVGVVVQSGTGSVVYGRSSRGKEMSSGGWSALLGEPGSAFHVGQHAIIAALRAKDGSGPKTSLLEEIPKALHMTLDDLVVLADSDMPAAVPRIASVSQAVFACAEKGDVESVHIRDEAALALSERLKSLIKLWPDKEVVPVSYAGRLMQGQPNFRQSIRAHLKDIGSSIEWREPAFRPPLGALLRVYPKLLEHIEKAEQSLDWHH